MVEHLTKLTSAELSMLWSTYIGDTMSICVLRHFFETCEDQDIKPIIQQALNYSYDHVSQITDLFTKEGIPLPNGFGEQDVNLQAKKLFSDVTYMRYLQHMGRTGLNSYSLAKSVSSRKDIRALFKQFYSQTEALYDDNAELMQEKGVYIRSPYISYPDKIQYVTERKFLGGLIGAPRPLLGVEIAHLGVNIEVANVAKTLLLGFSQVAQSKKLSDYFKDGYELGKKMVEDFMIKLKEDDNSYPSTWDSTVTNSTDAPFSDKLMLFHTNAQSAIGLGDFGLAIASSFRKDLILGYEGYILKIGAYVKEGANLLIDHGWFEKPPQSIDRESVRNQNK
ncbi:hypothetical protein QE429_000477 [Bacillus sp. SORGH_AS 510]|uniref:DUF3231 family protein n=1 Tax=Bacillus sp. SORGH_AS_0510 TaxID=3041771 RepID=UPI00278823E3|nr:DUF3231 family protein [Bacillus sp. SORGH_AS_0510]MDQ1143650.1 hypothetical protein [Bacillus sp. SORGH_AS_0510]